MAEEEKTEETPTQPAQRDWEAEAREMGWEESRKDEISAIEWVFTKPLRKENRRKEQALRNLQTRFGDLAERFKKLEAAEKERNERSTEALKRQRLQAVKDSDLEAFIRADDQFQKAIQPAAQPERTLQQPSAEHIAFVSENDWYGKDPHMTAWADAYGPRMRQSNPMMSEADFYAQIAEAAREAFPQKFESKKKPAPTVESGEHSTQKRSRDVGWIDMTKEAQEFFEANWKAYYPKLKRKEAEHKYAAALKEQGGYGLKE